MFSAWTHALPPTRPTRSPGPSPTRWSTPCAGCCRPEVADQPEDFVAAAIARIASLRPVTPDEANLAVHQVAASIQSLDCLRLARAHPNDPALSLKCIAQSASIMRQATSWRLTVHRAQAERRKSEAAAGSEAEQAEQPAPAVQPAPEPTELPAADPIAQAKHYALHHRKRATLIRRRRRLPERMGFWLPPEVANAIVTGTTPVLMALDEKRRRPAAVSA